MRNDAPYGMAAKRKIAPPKPKPNRPWTELSKAEQNAQYTQALYDYSHGLGPNPLTLGDFARKNSSAT